MSLDVLAGKAALVTGGASGIGFAIARACRDAGMRVVIADIDADGLPAAAAQLGSADEVLTAVLDIRDRAGWHDVIARTEAAFGPLHLLVNNAGVGSDGFELADMPPENFDRLIAINLTGAFNGVRAVAAGMRERQGGHIVNVASTAGLISAAGIGAYTAAKQGLVGLSEVLRAELAPHGVGVSVALPGGTRSRLGATTTRLVSTLARARADANAPIAIEDDPRMDPFFVGRRVLQGVLANELYIVTDPAYLPLVEARVKKIFEAFGEPAQPGYVERPEALRRMARNAYPPAGFGTPPTI